MTDQARAAQRRDDVNRCLNHIENNAYTAAMNGASDEEICAAAERGVDAARASILYPHDAAA